MKKVTLSLISFVVFVTAHNAKAQIYANSQTDSISQTCATCIIESAANSVDSTFSNYETMRLTNSATGASVTQKFNFQSAANAGSYVGIVVEDPLQGSLNSTLLSNLSITTFLSGVSNNDTKTIGSMIIYTTGGSLWNVEYTASNPFDQIEVTFNTGIAGAVDSIRIYYAYYMPAAPLPISLLSFSAQASEKCIDLKLFTASEQNNDHFTVEKSTDAVHYSDIANVNGSGTTSSINGYTYADQAPFSGVSYYRLKQSDFDGHSIYSGTVTVTYTTPKPGYYCVYPNPSGTGQIHLVTPSTGTTVKIISTTGQIVFAKTYSDAGDHAEDLSALTNPVAPGMYFVSFSSSEGTNTFRQIIQ